MYTQCDIYFSVDIHSSWRFYYVQEFVKVDFSSPYAFRACLQLICAPKRSWYEGRKINKLTESAATNISIISGQTQWSSSYIVRKSIINTLIKIATEVYITIGICTWIASNMVSHQTTVWNKLDDLSKWLNEFECARGWAAKQLKINWMDPVSTGYEWPDKRWNLWLHPPMILCPLWMPVHQ